MIPNSIKLSSDKKSLQIAYNEEKFIILSSHLLRAYTPSAENKKNLDSPNIEKFSGVLIKKIEIDETFPEYILNNKYFLS